MDETTRAAREDLAFMKAVAEDRGTPPAMLGAHLLAIGVCYSPNFLLDWAIFSGLTPWPQSLWWLTWAPGTVFYVPAVVALSLRGRGRARGPTAKLFYTAWTAVGLIFLPIVAVMAIGQIATGIAFGMLWPALSFVLYGGAWASVAIQKRTPWFGLVAAGCVATGALSAALLNQPAAWLVMAFGLAAFVAAPGGFILWQSRTAA